jgi:hypothetical protein
MAARIRRVAWLLCRRRRTFYKRMV